MEADQEPHEVYLVALEEEETSENLNRHKTSSIYKREKMVIAEDKLEPVLPEQHLASTEDRNSRCSDVKRLVMVAEDLLQKQAQNHMVLKKRDHFDRDEQAKSVNSAKMSRIKDWLKQNCDEENNCNQVQFRKKRSRNSTRPWSVSCLSQLNCKGASLAATSIAADVTTMSHIMSISESALNTLGTNVTPVDSSAKLRGSSATVQGHVSSSNTMTEAFTSCVESSYNQCWLQQLRHKQLKLKKRKSEESSRQQLLKSRSCGCLSPEHDRIVRSTSSEPNYSQATRFTTTSASGNNKDDNMIKIHSAAVSYHHRSLEPPDISNRVLHKVTSDKNEDEIPINFKFGPATGAVGLFRSRLTKSIQKEKLLHVQSFGNPSRIWEFFDKDSDIDRSLTAGTGTEEHSSFSEQAWDFYQEKYHSEPYSEAPDSEAARRLLEFGDDYRVFLDSRSDCCSSLSAQREPSPGHCRSANDSLCARRQGANSATPKVIQSLSSAGRRNYLLESRGRYRNNASVDSKDGALHSHSFDSDRNFKCFPEFGLPNVQSCANSNSNPEVLNSSLQYTNTPGSDFLNSMRKQRPTVEDETELSNFALPNLRWLSEGGGSSSSSKHKSFCWDSASEGVEVLLRCSSAQLNACEVQLCSHDAFDYIEIDSLCRENIKLLNSSLIGESLSPALEKDVRAVSTRWSALRTAASRRGSLRRLWREVLSLKEMLDNVREPGECSPRPHTREQLTRRMEELKERLFNLLETKVSLLKLTVSARRTLGETEADDGGVSAELASLLTSWDNTYECTFDELISLEKVVCAWDEWEHALRELHGALKGDLTTPEALKNEIIGVLDTEVTVQIRQMATTQIDRKASTNDLLSDSGLSSGYDADSGRVPCFSALRELARRLQASLGANPLAQMLIAKRMEQMENEVLSLRKLCNPLIEKSIPDFKAVDRTNFFMDKPGAVGSKADFGYPDSSNCWSWVRHVLRSSVPIQLCFASLLLMMIWLMERPRCCDALNSLTQTLTPQLHYVRGPPPI